MPDPSLPQTARRALGWMVLAQLCFAGMNVCTRLGALHLPWQEIAAARFLIGALAALGVSRVRGTSLRVTDQAGAWRRSIFGTLAALGSFYALASTSIGLSDAVTLGATAPVFVAVLSGPLLGERVGQHVWLAVAVAFVGIVALLRPSFELAAPVALALPQWTWPDLTGGLFLLGAGVGGGGAQLAMTRAYAMHRAAPLTALSNLGIVFTYLLALPLFPEHPSGWQLLGSLLVIVATILVGVHSPRIRSKG